MGAVYIRNSFIKPPETILENQTIFHYFEDLNVHILNACTIAKRDSHVPLSIINAKIQKVSTIRSKGPEVGERLIGFAI